MRTLFNFLIPGSLLVSGVIFLLHSPYIQQITQNNVDFAAIILAGLCALLAWRFDRFRALYTIQILIIADVAVRYLAGSSFTAAHLVVSATLLLNLSFVAVLKERGVHSLRGLFLLALPAIQTLGLLFLIRQESINYATLFNNTLLNLPSPVSTLPESILLLIGVALLTQLIRFLRYPNPLEGALFWTTFAVCVALYQPDPLQTTLLYAASILALFISFIETSHTLAYRDELTGVPGRRALMETFSKLGSSYTIAMVDIDFFKKFNDKYGHDIGDQVLKMVAARLAKCSGGGKAFRYGGEEFCIVFPGRGVEECMAHLEGLRASIGEQPFTFRKLSRPIKKPENKARSKTKNKYNTVTVTVSIGVAEKTALYNQPEVVMKCADQALYKAKEAGRNKVCR